MAGAIRASTATVRARSFYADVNATARGGRGALAALDDARCMRYLTVHIDRMTAQLRSVF